MSREFKILDDEYRGWIFVDKHSHTPSEYISYRNVIVHALFLLKNYTDNSLKKVLLSFKEAWDNHRYEWSLENIFLKIYWIRNAAQEASDYAVILDKSHGCYPILLDNDGRMKAFNNSLDDVISNFDKIIKLISEEKEWTKSLQDKLDDIYNCTESDDVQD